MEETDLRRQTDRQRVARALQALLAQFDDKFVISLASRLDRRARVQKEFSALGIDMGKAGVAWFDGLRFDDPAGFPNIGVRGCFSSHLALLRRCAQNGRPMLIMEDDVHFNHGAGAAWTDAVAAGDDWDLFYYGYTSPPSLPGTATVQTYDGPTIGGHFYAVTPGFAEAMAAFMEGCETRMPGHPLGGPMYRDGAFNHYRKMVGTVRTLVSVPSLAGQFSSRSDLARTHRLYDRLPVLQPLTNLARRFKTFAMR